MIRTKASLKGKINTKCTIKGKVSVGVEKIYPELEDLTVTPTAFEQNFKSSKYGYDNVKVEAIDIKLQSKEVIPTKNEQLIAADNGYTALSDVKVQAVTSSIDSNIDEKNIKKGVVILGVEGTLKEYVEPKLQDKEIVENGEYTADEGYDGLRKVNVNVPIDNTEYLNFLNRTFGDTYYAPEGATQIPTYTFYSDNSVKKIVCSSTMKTIGGWCCRQATKLEEVVLNEGITSIGQYAFYGCSNLSKINMPSSVKSLDMYCFHSCSKVTSIILPDGMKTLPNYSFYNCYSLTEFRIPETVTNINNYALSGCSALSRLTVPASVTNVGQNGLRIGFITDKATLIMKGEKPPTIASNSLNINEIEKILVPANAVDTYKTTTNWSAFADIISADV